VSTHDERSIEDLIEASSLGTPGAKAIRARGRVIRRSHDNCQHVRRLMREREPRIAAAYDRAVRECLRP